MNKKILLRHENSEKGITLIALVITIVLNCWRSGREMEYIV